MCHRALALRGARQGVDDLHAVFAAVRFVIDDMIAEGDQVVVIWTGDLLANGAGVGEEATGHQVTIAGITVYRVAVGKLVEARGVDDLQDALGQIDDLRLQ